jgi:ubiquinone/menaquinone biosynthesis C-methylase UbiE
LSCWDRILRKSEYSPEEPDEFVASSVKSLKRRPISKVLDLGCGGGRHLVYVAKQDLQAFGADFSSTGLSIARKRLEDQKLKAFLVKCDMKSLPFINSTFGLVICTRTI